MIADPEPPVIIRLLGTFEVRRGERVLLAEDWTRKKAAALLKRLAWERRLLKDQAIEFFWPEADPASAANKQLTPTASFPNIEKPPPLFVGRERELSVLHSYLESAVAGDGRIIFITGEAAQRRVALEEAIHFYESALENWQGNRETLHDF